MDSFPARLSLFSNLTSLLYSSIPSLRLQLKFISRYYVIAYSAVVNLGCHMPSPVSLKQHLISHFSALAT